MGLGFFVSFSRKRMMWLFNSLLIELSRFIGSIIVFLEVLGESQMNV